jgi:hypothetical protein
MVLGVGSSSNSWRTSSACSRTVSVLERYHVRTSSSSVLVEVVLVGRVVRADPGLDRLAHLPREPRAEGRMSFVVLSQTSPSAKRSMDMSRTSGMSVVAKSG